MLQLAHTGSSYLQLRQLSQCHDLLIVRGRSDDARGMHAPSSTVRPLPTGQQGDLPSRAKSAGWLLAALGHKGSWPWWEGNPHYVTMCTAKLRNYTFPSEQTDPSEVVRERLDLDLRPCPWHDRSIDRSIGVRSRTSSRTCTVGGPAHRGARADGRASATSGDANSNGTKALSAPRFTEPGVALCTSSARPGLCPSRAHRYPLTRAPEDRPHKSCLA